MLKFWHMCETNATCLITKGDGTRCLCVVCWSSNWICGSRSSYMCSMYFHLSVHKACVGVISNAALLSMVNMIAMATYHIFLHICLVINWNLFSTNALASMGTPSPKKSPLQIIDSWRSRQILLLLKRAMYESAFVLTVILFVLSLMTQKLNGP